jgi:hypothetical protein
VRALAAAAALVGALALPAGAAAQQSLTGIDITVTAGEAFTRAVATLEQPGLPPQDLVATIDWGDGTPATGGTIAQVGRTTYEVSGTHTYAATGTRTMRISVRYPDGGELRTVATATVQAPPAPPPPAPPPPPPPPTARLTLAKPAVERGELILLDASGSTGQAQSYAFDLNGNGTLETKCGTPYAGAVLSTAGSRELAVRAIGPGAPTAIGRATVNVAGGRQAPPKGQAALKAGTTVGGCLAHMPNSVTELAAALEQAYNCPQTVQVGVAEATIPQVEHFPPLLGDPCFKRESSPTSSQGPGLKHPDYPRFVAQQKIVHVNGIEIDTWPISPSGSYNSLIVSEPERSIRSKNAGAPVVMRVRREGVGALTSEHVKMGTWYVGKPGVVGTFPIEDFLSPKLLGMAVVSKETPITFTANREARLKVFVVPPFSFLGTSTPTGKPLDLITDNTDGLRVEGGSAVTAGGGGTYDLDMPLGVFRLTGKLVHTNEGGSNVWQGNVKLEIPNSPVDHITGFIRFRDGTLEYATVSAPFAGSGIGPLFPPVPVYLVQLGGTLTPYSIQADATFAAGPKLFGDFRAATAKANLSILFSPFLISFTADELKIMHWSVKANTNVVVTKSFFLASLFWGPVNFGPITNFRVNVLAKIGNPWVIAGGGTACFNVFIAQVGCAAINAAAGPKGITGCAAVKIAGVKIAGGVGMPWNPFKVWDWWPYWGCSFELVQAEVSAARAAAIRAGARAAAYPVRVPRGLRAGLFVVRGSGAKPRVRLRGPDGTQITTPPPGQDQARDDRWLALGDTNDDSVHVVVARPAPGRWQVSELEGSPAVRSVHFAKPLPDRFARARVSGRGRARTLRYQVAKRPGVQVRFLERGGDLDDPETVVEQPIGRATRARGSIRFTVADAKLRRRRIDAVVESQGSVIKTETVARFTAPRFRPPPAPRVSVRRRRGSLLVRWRRVAGARAYQVLVDRSDGPTLHVARRARALKVGGITGVTAARVQVRAVSAAGYIGRPGVARARPPAPLALPRSLSPARVLRRGFTVRCTAAGEGRCIVTVERGRRTLAAGARRLGYGQTARVAVRPTPAGRRALRGALRSGRALTATMVPSVPGVGLRSRRVSFR